jgi:hypothetical protein
MKTTEVLQAWSGILTGHRPSLSIEITKECPLFVYTPTRSNWPGDSHAGATRFRCRRPVEAPHPVPHCRYARVINSGDPFPSEESG